jgi:hypothetical protein
MKAGRKVFTTDVEGKVLEQDLFLAILQGKTIDTKLFAVDSSETAEAPHLS